MKVTLGQINTTPGDFEGNMQQIFAGIEKADRDNAQMVVFPELSIPGYLTCDLMFEKNYISRCRKELHRLIDFTSNYPHLYVVVGYIGKNNEGTGKPFANLLAVLNDGTLVGKYQKRLLPFYDVFDEGRYYQPGNRNLVLDIYGRRVGFTICEDCWNDKDMDDYNYHDNPIQEYRKLEIDLMVNISSSPYSKDKPRKRISMLSKVSKGNDKDSFDLVYVNQIGGQDELVFDGKSCTFKKGLLHSRLGTPIKPSNKTGLGKGTDPLYYTVDLSKGCHYIPVSDLQTDHLSMTLMGLYDYGKKSGFSEYVIGSSGGIDSAVVISLASIAFGPENVHAIKMPSKWNSDSSLMDAIQLHKNLGVNDYTVPIEHEGMLDNINERLNLQPDSYNSVADQNIQARIRGQVIMHFSNATGALALTTGNKTELALGYCTLYGDMDGGFNPIGDLYKLEVYDLANKINDMFNDVIPQNIIDKAPSAELAPDQTDEDNLLPYLYLDPIVKTYVEEYIGTWKEYLDYMNPKVPYGGCESEEDNMLSGWLHTPKNKEKYDDMIRRIDLVEYKRRQAAPCTRLTKKSFGTGRRLPIVKKYVR